jgi:hypothetical protein
MAQENIARKTRYEQASLDQIAEAIRRLRSWDYRGGGFPRQLGAIQSLAHAFQQHLERLLALKEEGGYLEEVVDASPHLSEQVETLHQEQAEFHALLERMIARIERVSPTHRARAEVVADELFSLLHKLEEHDRKETDLLQEAFLRDEGGEG